MLQKRKDDIYNSEKWDCITKSLVALLVAFLFVYFLIQFTRIPSLVAIGCLAIILAALLFIFVYAICLAIRELKRGGIHYRKLLIDIGVIIALAIVIIMNFAYLIDQEKYARNVTWSTIVLSFVTAFQVVYAVIDDVNILSKKRDKVECAEDISEIIAKDAVSGDIEKLVKDIAYSRNEIIAKKMLDDNVLSASKIAEYTDLSIESVRALQEEHRNKENKKQKE